MTNQVNGGQPILNGDLNLPPRVDILGVGVNALNMVSAVELVDKKLSRREKGYVCVTDVNAIMTAQKDPAYKSILNDSFLTTPDGMPTVWIGRHRGHLNMSRVHGTGLMQAVCALSVQKGYSQYLIGGGTGVANDLRTVLCRRFPGLQVVGTYTPPFRPMCDEEEQRLINDIAVLKPDIVWVGLGAPKQERFMAGHLDKLDTTLMFGVGAAFDFMTGRQKEAPLWMQKVGLQWAHRIYCEPRRLWRRYLFNNPAFVLSIMSEAWSSGKRKGR